MAAATRSSEGLECPVCMDLMSVPIFNCQSGHSLCNVCTQRLPTPKCPICRENMTQIRNRHLEGLVAKVEVICPNKGAGCIYKMKPADVDGHLRECIFREMACPHGAVFGKCSWEGKLKDMASHFAERHAEACGVSCDADVQLAGVRADADDRHLFLATSGKALFIITFKIDTSQKMAFWCIQNIGPKATARQWLYEIHVTSPTDARRKVTFTDHCFSDAVKPEEVFRTGKCATLPAAALATFIRADRLAFRFFLKRGGPAPAREDRPDGQNGAPPPPGPGKPHYAKKDKGKPHPGQPQPGKPGPGKPGPGAAFKKPNKSAA